MKKLSVGEFKAQFSEVIQDVKSGKEIAVTFGKKKEIIGYFIPYSGKKLPERKLGILKGKATVAFMDDFKMTESELIGL
jgi:antitoxin (DNA-binding transcriptional repressor) of toxin-antitoxin stability system